jgi:hypothetical protein
MRRSYPTRKPKETVFRVAIGSNPLVLRSWSTIAPDTPFKGRWDDPLGEYRVLYTSATPKGALREALQYFRPSPELMLKLSGIVCELGELPLAGIGIIPVSWLARRTLSQLHVESGACVPICATDALDVVYRECGLKFTVGELLAPANLEWTQRISRMVWSKRVPAGIEAPSKLGVNLRNYAFFEETRCSNTLRARLGVIETKKLSPENPLLVSIAKSLNLRFENPSLETKNVSFLSLPNRRAA